MKQPNTALAKCTIDPRNDWKTRWDLWIVFVLCFVAMTLPFQIGFVDDPGTAWQVFNYLVDASFVIDMLLTFFTAIQDI